MDYCRWRYVEDGPGSVAATVATVAAGRIWWTEPGGEASVCWCWGACLPRELLWWVSGELQTFDTKISRRSNWKQAETLRGALHTCSWGCDIILGSAWISKQYEKTERGKRRTNVKDFQIYKDFSMMGGKKQLNNNWEKVHFCTKRIILKCWN